MAPKKLTPNEKQERVVERMIALRENGWTLEKLAAQLSVSCRSVARWTQEGDHPSLTRVDDLLDKLKGLR